MKNNKLFQYIVIGLFIFFILVGAILFATYKSTTNVQSQINVTIWGTLDGVGFNSFVRKYFSDNDIKYIVNYVQKSITTFDQDLVEALASGAGPDAVILPQDLIVHYMNKVFRIPYNYTDGATTLSAASFINDYVQEGKLYMQNDGVLAIPFTIDPLVMYWNRDIFNSSGLVRPPATWPEVSGLVPTITIKDQAQNITRSTIALGEFRNVNNAKEILSALFMQTGNSIIKINSDDTLSSDIAAVEADSPIALALQFYASFSNPSKAQYSWNRSLQNSLNSFTNGDSAIYLGFASEYVKIKQKNPNLNFEVAVLPQAKDAKVKSTYGKMLGFAIMKSSLDPAGTYTVISTLTSAAAYPAWADLFDVSSARNDILGLANKSAAKTVFNQSAIISKGWLDPNSIETDIIFKDMVESYTTGRAGLDTAVSALSAQLSNLLQAP